jgi:hypothetical protein
LYNGGFRLVNGSNVPLGWQWNPAVIFSLSQIANYAGVAVNGSTTSTSDPIPVLPSAPFTLQAEMFTVGVTAGSVSLDVLWFSDAAGTAFISNDADMPATNGVTWTKYTRNYISPANAASAKVRLKTTNMTVTGGNIGGWRRIKFASSSIVSGDTPFSDEATNSSTLLTNSGTGILLGDGFAVPPIVAAGTRYFYSTNPSFGNATTSSATITLPAGTLTVGGRTVSYPTMTTTVTGASGTTIHYYLYGDDPRYSGTMSNGLVATTNYLAPYQSTGRIFLGELNVTFSTGSTGGGTGGGGGGLNCVAATSWVHTKRGWLRAYDVVPGDELWVLNSDKTGGEWAEVDRNLLATEECYYLYGADSDIGVTISHSTPIELEDGTFIKVKDVDGHELAFEHNGELWKEKTYVRPVGKKNVCKIHCGNKCYSAGDIAEQGIFAHNAAKP